MSEISSETLFETATLSVRDVHCRGTCRHASAEECTRATHLVFPYRGVYVRHVGSDQAVAEANQVMFFNGDEPYRVSHPVTGGDANLSLHIGDALLMELAPSSMLRARSRPFFSRQRLRVDARAQALVALLRHSLRSHAAEPLEAEGLALTLARRALGPRTTHAPASSHSHQRLVDRAKLVLARDLARRWTLAEIANEVGGSPVHLTRVFQMVEGMPLYRYQRHLRLARALDLIAEYDDLTTLGLDLGFSSHSHFTAAFREVYGRAPSEFRAIALRRRANR
jgi:AraC-like DNA-binding protein